MKKKEKINFKKWLTQNKIYFETVAAFLLSIMAIVMSYLQFSISEQQTELLVKQKEIADTKLKNQILDKKITYIKNWNEVKSNLRNAELLFGDSYWNEDLVKDFFKTKEINKKKKWVNEFLELIKPIGANRVIIENRSLHENYLIIEFLLHRLQRDYTYIKYDSIFKDFDNKTLLRVWKQFRVINIFMNRPAKVYRTVEDSSFIPDIRLWQFSTDSLLKGIENLIESNKIE